MKTTFSFTTCRVHNIKPEQNTKSFSDNKLKNLKLVVTGNGTKTFYVRFKFKNKSYNEKLGHFDLLGVDEARYRAIEYMNHIRAESKDLIQHQNFTKDLKYQTVNDVFKSY